MKTKKIYSDLFSSTIKAISYAARKAQEGILHSNYNSPLQGIDWGEKFARELFHKYVSEELIEQVKIDHTIAEANQQTWMSSMSAYIRPRCYIDKLSTGDLIQHAITNKTQQELKKCQEALEEDYKTIFKIKAMEERNKNLTLSANWRLQKLFPNDRVIKQAANNNFYILGDYQIGFIAQNYMDLVRHGWVYK